MTETIHTTLFSSLAHKHNTLAHIAAHIKEFKAIKVPFSESSGNYKLQRLFDNTYDYALFPIGKLAYEHLFAIRVPQLLTDEERGDEKLTLLRTRTLDELDPSREMRDWLDEQVYALNHYLNRKMLKSNKTYLQIILDSLFPERKDDPNMYQEYEEELRSAYIGGFFFFANFEYAKGSEDLARLQLCATIATRYAQTSTPLQHLESIIEREIKAQGNDNDLTLTRIFQNLDSIYFPIPLMDYEAFKKLKIAKSVQKLNEDFSNPTIEVNKDDLKNINLLDPDQSWRHLIFSYLQRLDDFLYSQAEVKDTFNIRLLFNALYPEQAKNDAAFQKVEMTIRTAYFSGFIVTLVGELPLEMKDIAAKVFNLAVKEAALRAPRIKKPIEVKPFVKPEAAPASKDLFDVAKNLLKKQQIFDKAKEELGLNTFDLTSKNYKTLINHAYKELYTVHDGEFLIHKYLRQYVKENHPELYNKDECLYRFNNEWEKKFREELLRSMTRGMGENPHVQKTVDLYITAKERELHKKHRKVTDKEFRKLARTLERFANRVRFGNDGWYLDTKYHAIHDVSEQIKTELHDAYAQRRLLSPKEKQLLKQRCLGAVDAEMKLILKKHVTKGLWHHLAKKYRDWREGLAKMFTFVERPTAKFSANNDIESRNSTKSFGSGDTESSTGSQSSLGSTVTSVSSRATEASQASEDLDTLPQTKTQMHAKSHHLWTKVMGTFEEVASDETGIEQPYKNTTSPAA